MEVDEKPAESECDTTAPLVVEPQVSADESKNLESTNFPVVQEQCELEPTKPTTPPVQLTSTVEDSVGNGPGIEMTLDAEIPIVMTEEPTTTKDDHETDNKRCYCGKGRNFNEVELQCAVCLKWHHESCIKASIGRCIPFMTNYTFICKNCSQIGMENFIKRQSNFSQICITSIANLMQKSRRDGNLRLQFSKDKEIIPFVEKNWEMLTTMQRRIKQTWHNTLYKTMLKDCDVFSCEDQASDASSSREGYPMFGLVLQDLSKIGPCYETFFKPGQIKFADSHLGPSGFGGITGKSRSTKRKFPGDSQSSTSRQKIKSDLTMPKLPSHGYPFEHPFNKDGYRYILAEPDPHAPFRQEFDESSDWAGKPIPGWLYRTLVPDNVFLAMHDRAPQLRMGEDRLTVTGEKGYCMVRATHGISRGTWYFECTLEEMPEGAATRLGWSQPLGNLQAPLGFDKFGYSWRSRKGTCFHQSRGHHYSDEGYGQGDVVGTLIELPLKDDLLLPFTYKDKPLVKFKSYLYFEEKDEVQDTLKMLKPCPGSKVMFFKNGKSMQTAWEDIFDGAYYPAISIYKSCTVSLNFGPNFKYPPKDIKFRSVYEAAHQALIEQTMADILFFVENKGRLTLDCF